MRKNLYPTKTFCASGKLLLFFSYLLQLSSLTINEIHYYISYLLWAWERNYSFFFEKNLWTHQFSLGWTIRSALLWLQAQTCPWNWGYVFLLYIISLFCFMSFRTRHCISPWQSAKKSQLMRGLLKRKKQAVLTMHCSFFPAWMYRWCSY